MKMSPFVLQMIPVYIMFVIFVIVVIVVIRYFVKKSRGRRQGRESRKNNFDL